MNFANIKLLLIASVILVALGASAIVAYWIFTRQLTQESIFQNQTPSSVAPSAPSTSFSQEGSNLAIKTYTNTEFGFEFQYPKDWSFHANTFGGPFTKFNLVGASPEENNLPNPILPSILINIVTPDLANMANINLRKLDASTSVVVVAGIQGTKYEYEFEGTKKISIYLPLGEYQVNIGTQKRYEDVFNQILSSFKFLK